MKDRVEFWEKKWENNQSFWHKNEVNEFLERHYEQLVGLSRKRIFVPLCGKSLDLKWLYDQGHEVVGLDGAEKPIKEFFDEHNLIYTEHNSTAEGHYFTTSDGRLKIFHCDLFAAPLASIGKFDCVWDRGSLVAIYQEDREQYAALIKQLLKDDFRYLIDTMVYDQTKFSGPPRSVSVEDITSLMGSFASIQVLEEVDRNQDENTERTPRVRWNLDVCHEVIVLLSPRH